MCARGVLEDAYHLPSLGSWVSRGHLAGGLASSGPWVAASCQVAPTLVLTGPNRLQVGRAGTLQAWGCNLCSGAAGQCWTGLGTPLEGLAIQSLEMTTGGGTGQWSAGRMDGLPRLSDADDTAVHHFQPLIQRSRGPGPLPLAGSSCPGPACHPTAPLRGSFCTQDRPRAGGAGLANPVLAIQPRGIWREWASPSNPAGPWMPGPQCGTHVPRSGGQQGGRRVGTDLAFLYVIISPMASPLVLGKHMGRATEQRPQSGGHRAVATSPAGQRLPAHVTPGGLCSTWLHSPGPRLRTQPHLDPVVAGQLHLGRVLAEDRATGPSGPTLQPSSRDQ